MDRIKFLGILALCIFLGCSNQDKGEKVMKEVKDLYGNTIGLDEKNQVIMKDYTYNFKTAFDPEITKIPISDKSFLEREKIRRTKQLEEVQSILSSSPFYSYTPSYLNPSDSRDRSYFLEWRDLYLKEPLKGSIAPWSKEEKAYYLSLQSKKERYIYLVKRSGLKCAIIDIPQEAIGNAKEFPEITQRVEENRGTLKSYLHIQEWNLCAGILGDANGFAESGAHGFNARYIQSFILYLQLTGGGDRYGDLLKGLANYGLVIKYGKHGIHKNPLKASIIENLAQSIQPDEYGMLPFIDEMIGVDWIMDFSKIDTLGDITDVLDEEIRAGKLLDPREARSTKESREEFRAKTKFLLERSLIVQSFDTPNNPQWDSNAQDLTNETRILEAKIMAVTPPQGYIYAPYYYFPKELDALFEAGKLDRKLDPRIEAYRRVGFPHELVKKIEEFKRKK